MSALGWLQGVVAKLDPLDWWLIGFVIFSLTVGTLSGYFRARKIQPKGFKLKIFLRHEMMWATINIAVSAFTLGTLNTFLRGNELILFNPEPVAPWVIAVEFGLYFVAFDAYFYWLHRLMHIEPVYTLFHKVHHGSISTNPLTSISVSPLEAFVNGAFVPLFTMTATLLSLQFSGVSPIHTATMALIAPTNIIMGFYVHSGFEFLPRWWNKSWATKWFITATFHDQHHRFFKGNYGGYTTFWDRVCNTMRPHYEADFEKITTRPIEPRWLVEAKQSVGGSALSDT